MWRIPSGCSTVVLRGSVWLAAAAATIMLAALGCGQAYEGARSAAEGKMDQAPPQAAPAEGEAEPPNEAVAGEGVAQAERKIIYTANVALVVDDFAETERKIQALTQQYGGFVAEFREDRTYGDRLAGRWVVRTPVRRFQEFLDAVVALGVPETRQIDAQDVTEEFVDLEARLANKRKLEERILDLLENQTGEIKDVIAVETELARVREEIERMEGRLRFLTNRVELTTITISAREEYNYEPPQAPTFTGKIRSTWNHSLAALWTAFEGIVLFVVAIAPWLVVLAVLASPLAIWLARSSRRKTFAAEAVEER